MTTIAAFAPARTSAPRTAAPRTSAPRTAAPRVRLTVRGRRALALVVAAPVLVAGGLAGAGMLGGAVSGAVASSSVDTQAFEHITVQPGQTLWQIAASIAPSSDPRDVIAEIQVLNDIRGAIQPGQRLAIPLQYSR